MSRKRTRAERPGPAQSPSPWGGRKPSATIRRWMRFFGEMPSPTRIAAATGLVKSEVSMALTETRHTPRVQDAIARAVGKSTEALFGDAAWSRIAGAELAKRQRIPA